MKEHKEIAIGIDFGLTNSLVAVCINNEIKIIPNEIGDFKTPSKVIFSGDQVYIGEETYYKIIKNPKNIIYGVKRLIGRYFEEKDIQKEINQYLSYKVEAGEKTKKGHLSIIIVDYKNKKHKFSPEKIVSLILKKLKKNAESFLDTEVKYCVVSIPSYFREEQKTAMIKSCNEAGLEVFTVISESEATVLSYGLKVEKEKQNILIFKLEKEIFEISIIEIKNNGITNKGKYEDLHFGGEDFDNALVDYFINLYNEIKKKKINKYKDEKPFKRLKIACNMIKKKLSIKEKDYLYIENFEGDEDFSSTITRDLFEKICSHLFNKCISSIRDLLDKIGISSNDIGNVIFIGGATKIPKFKEIIKNIFGLEPYTSIDPVNAVVYGSAIEASRLLKLNNIKKREKDINNSVLTKIIKEKEEIIKNQNIKIKELEEKINNINSNSHKQDNLISIIIQSDDENILCSFICNDSDIFLDIEKKIYNKYPNYNKKNNIFISNDRKIDKNNSLKENNIKDNDIIILKLGNIDK